jgi:hypothetical protein
MTHDLPITDIALKLRLAADSLACARFGFPSEGELGIELAAEALNALPSSPHVDLLRSLLADDPTNYDGLFPLLDSLADELEPREPPNKPSRLLKNSGRNE